VGGLEFSHAAQQWVNVVLIWIGFGTLTGLAARVLVPGRDPGLMGTLVIGVVGSVIGPLVLVSALGREQFNPISPIGFFTSIGGAVALLILYRILTAFATARRDPGGQEQHAES
jgi:uncharacterized membrane protein YeaQ/YmgE (transglycosylase-associated protein family)